MKKIDRLRKEGEITMDKIRAISRHIRHVEDNCLVLGEKLIEAGQLGLGKQLIANGFVHDASKFHGIEWLYMSPGQPTAESEAKLKLKLAIQHHNHTNLHHPEAWGSIHEMPDVYLAEMVCDIKSRSEEFGTSLREWIDSDATKRFNFTEQDEVYKKIMHYISLICATPFTKL